MIEDNYRDSDEVKMITNQVWKSMSLLRGVLPVEHHHVYLFLLSAYYDGVIKSVHIDFSDNLHNYLFSSLENEQRYSRIMDVYRPIIKSIPEERLNEVLRHFTMFDNEVLEQYFDEIFDDLLFKLADNQGKYSGEFLLPNEISKFVMKLAKTPNQASVFNPFAGLASFATHLKNDERYYGQEIVNSTWALGMLRLMRQHKYAQIDYKVEDSINNWPEYENFDLVVSNPPFNFKVSPDIESINFGIEQFEDRSSFSKANQRFNAEQYVIQRGLQSINFDGKVVCITSMGFLFRGGREGRLRKHLINEGLVETIVSLPGGLLRHTGIPICVIVLTRKRNSNGVVRMIDGSDFVLDFGKRDKRLDLDRILEAISSDNIESVRYIDIQQIAENDYNLSVKRYFISEFTGIPLSDVITPIRGQKALKFEEGIFIRTSSLQGDDVNYTLNISGLKRKELPSNSRKLEESVILISTRWKTLKPTLFIYTGTPIFIGMEILAFTVNEQLIDSVYLINELKSSTVTKQVLAYQFPAAIQSIRKDDLLKIKVEIPSLEEQKAKVRGILEYSEKLKILQRERNLLAHGQQVKSFDEFASLKHSLGAPRQNILSNTKSLIRFFESNNSESFSEVKNLYKEKYGNNLIEDISQIKNDINHISAILEKGEQGLVLSNYDLTSISLKDINRLLMSLKKPSQNFTLHYDKASLDEIKGKAILANLTLFEILLNNILSNASKYAFEDNNTMNLLIIELKVIEDKMLLEIRNNGKPFPRNYDKQKFIAKYTTANPSKGTGLGGYDINRIAGYFDNQEWELNLNEDEVFPVVLKFNFPIIPMINE